LVVFYTGRKVLITLKVAVQAAAGREMVDNPHMAAILKYKSEIALMRSRLLAASKMCGVFPAHAGSTDWTRIQEHASRKSEANELEK
jgi:hypothetical protein